MTTHPRGTHRDLKLNGVAESLHVGAEAVPVQFESLLEVGRASGDQLQQSDAVRVVRRHVKALEHISRQRQTSHVADSLADRVRVEADNFPLTSGPEEVGHGDAFDFRRGHRVLLKRGLHQTQDATIAFSRKQQSRQQLIGHWGVGVNRLTLLLRVSADADGPHGAHRDRLAANVNTVLASDDNRTILVADTLNHAVIRTHMGEPAVPLANLDSSVHRKPAKGGHAEGTNAHGLTVGMCEDSSSRVSHGRQKSKSYISLF